MKLRFSADGKIIGAGGGEASHYQGEEFLRTKYAHLLRPRVSAPLASEKKTDEMETKND